MAQYNAIQRLQQLRYQRWNDGIKGPTLLLLRESERITLVNIFTSLRSLLWVSFTAFAPVQKVEQEKANQRRTSWRGKTVMVASR